MPISKAHSSENTGLESALLSAVFSNEKHKTYHHLNPSLEGVNHPMALCLPCAQN